MARWEDINPKEEFKGQFLDSFPFLGTKISDSYFYNHNSEQAIKIIDKNSYSFKKFKTK